MSQQINLYQPIFRKQKKIFSALTIVQVAGVFVLGLLLIYGFAWSQVRGLQVQVAGLEAQRDATMEQLQRLSAAQSPVRSRTLERQVSEAQREHDQSRSLMEVFADGRYGGSAGFSGHFTGLARQRIDGLWLTRVRVGSGGEITFEGAAEAPELLPRYIARLGREEAFSGTEFSRLQLARGEDTVRFAVSTRAEDER